MDDELVEFIENNHLKEKENIDDYFERMKKIDIFGHPGGKNNNLTSIENINHIGLIFNLLENGNQYEDYEQFKEDHKHLFDKLDVRIDTENTKKHGKSSFEIPKGVNRLVTDQDHDLTNSETPLDVYGMMLNMKDFEKNYPWKELNNFIEGNYGHKLLMKKLHSDIIKPEDIDINEEKNKEKSEEIRFDYLDELNPHIDYEENDRFPIDRFDWVKDGVFKRMDTVNSLKKTFIVASSVFSEDEIQELDDEIKKDYRNLQRTTGSHVIDSYLSDIVFHEIHNIFYDSMQWSEFGKESMDHKKILLDELNTEEREKNYHNNFFS